MKQEESIQRNKAKSCFFERNLLLGNECSKTKRKKALGPNTRNKKWDGAAHSTDMYRDESGMKIFMWF